MRRLEGSTPNFALMGRRCRHGFKIQVSGARLSLVVRAHHSHETRMKTKPKRRK